MNIYPTHSCFDDALENLIRIMKTEGRDIVKRGDLLIVHGIIAPYGYDIAHAWLEREGKTVIFTGVLHDEKVLVTCDRAEYYANSKVKDTTKYTLFEAYAAEVKAGHFGPWEDRYLRLCPDQQRKKVGSR